MRVVVVACLAQSLGTPAAAQWLDTRTPGIPRTADGRPNLAAIETATRTPTSCASPSATADRASARSANERRVFAARWSAVDSTDRQP
jgi:hypothetical protein